MILDSPNHTPRNERTHTHTWSINQRHSLQMQQSINAFVIKSLFVFRMAPCACLGTRGAARLVAEKDLELAFAAPKHPYNGPCTEFLEQLLINEPVAIMTLSFNAE